MANMLAERIKTVTLTRKQKKIAEYFIQNQERLGSLSLLELANEIGVSDASIIRFSRLIGFDGYADLKNHIYEMLVEQASPSLSLSERHSRNKEKYGKESPESDFQQLAHQKVTDVFQKNKREDFEKTADMIVSSRVRYVIGMRGCKGIALQFGRLLSFMLPNVITLIDGECTSINSLQDVREGDVVIMFALSRFYKIDMSYIRMARERGAGICLVEDDITGPLSSYADVVLMANVSNMSFFHSTIGVNVLAEYILNLVSDKAEFKERIEERDRVTQDQRM